MIRALAGDGGRPGHAACFGQRELLLDRPAVPEECGAAGSVRAHTMTTHSGRSVWPRDLSAQLDPAFVLAPPFGWYSPSAWLARWRSRVAALPDRDAMLCGNVGSEFDSPSPSPDPQDAPP